MGDPDIKSANREEIKKLTMEASEVGLVHCTDNRAENTTILCACCECCCGMIGGLTRLDNPRSLARANFISKVDEEMRRLWFMCGYMSRKSALNDTTRKRTYTWSDLVLFDRNFENKKVFLPHHKKFSPHKIRSKLKKKK